MNSDLPLVLHPVSEVPMLCHVVRAAQELEHSKVVIVASPQSGAAVQQVLEGAFPSLGHDIVLQEKPTGFRDAVMAGLQSLPDSTADLLVIPGNLPLLTSQALAEVAQQGQRTAIEKCKGLTQLCAPSDEPSGIFWAAAAFLRERIRDLPNGMSDSLDAEGLVDGQCERCCASDPSATMAVHTRQEVVDAETVLRRRHIREHQAQGVTFRDPENTFISAGVDIGRDSVIGIGVQLYGNTSIGRCVRIDGPTVIINSTVGSGCRIGAFSHLEQATMAENSGVGPFARLRVGAVVESAAYVGNFCEVKAAHVGAGTNVCHLSYLGDAEVGENVNIGAGTITCNYNGIAKNRTTIGSNAFIGSSSTLVAPVEVGEGALVAAGSVITSNVPINALALGRARQTTKEDRADATREKLRELHIQKQAEQ
ncbi:g6266 [Coccomyxa elongata]